MGADLQCIRNEVYHCDEMALFFAYTDGYRKNTID